MFHRRNHPKAAELKEGVTAAFKSLRKQGYVTRQNFSCCGSCASYAIGVDMRKKGVKEEDQKAVYFSRQGEDHLWKSGKVFINWSGDGKAIVAALEAEGLSVDWNGTEHGAIGAFVGEPKPVMPNLIEQ